MNKYIIRLMHCGYSPHEAYKTYWDFIKEYGLMDFIDFITSLEKNYVCRI